MFNGKCDADNDHFVAVALAVSVCAHHQGDEKTKRKNGLGIVIIVYQTFLCNEFHPNVWVAAERS